MRNFGKIRNAFDGLLIDSLIVENVKSKELFKNHIKNIRKNDILKTQFIVYNNIESKFEENPFKANLFLQENLNLLSKYSKKEIEEANVKLAKDIDISDVKPYPKSDLHENIAKLIFLERNAKNIDTIVETTSEIVEYMKNNKSPLVQYSEAIELPNSLLTNIMVEKYNEKYSSLDESEKKIIKSLLDSNEDEKKNIYKDIVRECIDLINVRLLESNLESKDKLLSVKDKLLNDGSEINEDFIKKISKLVELRRTLK